MGVCSDLHVRLRRQPLALALALCCAAGPAAAGEAVAADPNGGAHWIVENCDDDGPGSLRDAIENLAASGDSVDLSQLDCSLITLTTGAIFASGDLAVSGPAVIDGGNDSPIFVHTGGGILRLENLAMTHGRKYAYGTADARGGCIYSEGSVALDHSQAKYCSAIATGDGGAFGGAVYALGNVTLTNSTISGNEAVANGKPSFGGGIYAAGRGVFKYSTIHNNSVDGGTSKAILGLYYHGAGGGAWVAGGGTVIASTISGNDAYGYAGGIWLGAYTGAAGIDVLSSTISGNTSTFKPAGLLIGSFVPGATIANSTITDNRVAESDTGAGVVVDANTTALLISSVVGDNWSMSSGTPVGADVAGGGALDGHHNLIAASTLAVPPGTIVAAPHLVPLTDNGGPTRTHALGIDSPAVDHGDANGQSFDQRGYARVAGIAADIGAFESGAQSDTIFVDGFD